MHSADCFHKSFQNGLAKSKRLEIWICHLASGRIIFQPSLGPASKNQQGCLLKNVKVAWNCKYFFPLCRAVTLARTGLPVCEQRFLYLSRVHFLDFGTEYSVEGRILEAAPSANLDGLETVGLAVPTVARFSCRATKPAQSLTQENSVIFEPPKMYLCILHCWSGGCAVACILLPPSICRSASQFSGCPAC